MEKKIVSDSRRPTRALQAYLVLIGLAWNRQTITYGDISQNQMEFGDGGILAHPLGCILGWCHENKLPPLTSLVVNAETGVPGLGLGIDPNDIPNRQQAVFAFNWFSLFPPTIEELEGAGKRAVAGTLIDPGLGQAPRLHGL